MRPSLTTTASRGSALAICSVSQSGSIGVALPRPSMRAARSARLAVQFSFGELRQRRLGPAGEPLAALLAPAPASAPAASRAHRRARPSRPRSSCPCPSRSRPMWTTGRSVGQRLDLAPHRHAHRIGAEHDQQVELGQHAAHLLLVAREPAGVAGMLGEEMRAVGRALLIDGRAQRLGEGGGASSASLLTISSPTMMTGRSACSSRLASAVEHRIGGARAGVDARRGAELDAGLGVEDVARQRDEHRPGRRRHRHLGGAATMRGRSSSRVTSTAHFTSGSAIGTSGS